MKTFGKLISILFFAILCASCAERVNPEPKTEDRKPASISLTLDIADFGLSAPTPSTRSEIGADLDTPEINSCAICLFKLDEVNPSNSRVVAYRIFIAPHTDGHKYFFRNVNPAKYFDDMPTPAPLANVPVSAAGGIHASGADDSTSAESEFGLNGISADKQSVTANFLFDHPIHGPVEQLRNDEYLIIALANFHEEPIVATHKTLGYWIKEQIKYWQDHQSSPGFDGIVNDPIMSGSELVFSGCRQILNARVRLYDAHIISLATPGQDPAAPIYIDSHDDVIRSDTYVHHSSTSLCTSAVLPVKVKSGANNFSLDLTRLATRATFTINNQSPLPIAIDQFSLSDNFASAATYLFPIGPREYNSPTWMGAPDPTASHALVTYDPNTYHPGGSSEVFFDALFASGHDVTGTSPLSFSISVGIDDGNTRQVSSISNRRNYADFRTDLASAEWPVGEGREYCFQTIRRNNFLHIVSGVTRILGTNNTSDSPDLATEIAAINEKLRAEAPSSEDLSYIWIIEKVSSNTVRLKSKSKEAASQDAYIKALNNSQGGGNIGYSDQAGASIFRVNQHISNPGGINNGTPESVAFDTDVSSVEVYINESTSTRNLITCAKWCDDGAHFYLYPVQQRTTYAISKSLNTAVRAYNNNTGTSAPLHELRRNDHLNVSINVNYNPYTQDIDLVVKDWEYKDNEISFH